MSSAATPAPPPVLLAGPVLGKTYSLYGDAPTSDGYFDAVSRVADGCAERPSDDRWLLREAERELAPYFRGVEAHRADLPLRSRCSRTLAMRREQYLSCAVEIELNNRHDLAAFARCSERIALLPHCLRNVEADCRARPHGLDTICMGCSEGCYIRAVSRVLRRHRVQPYIWMNANLRRLLRRPPGTLGVLGIACIPELAAGMRACARAGVPVLGVPLGANRCARWLGQAKPNTVNLTRIELLLAAT